jgi:hypothetical protein
VEWRATVSDGCAYNFDYVICRGSAWEYAQYNHGTRLSSPLFENADGLGAVDRVLGCSLGNVKGNGEGKASVF